MAKKSTRKVARDAETGRFIPVEQAKRHPKTTVVETIKTTKTTSKKRKKKLK